MMSTIWRLAAVLAITYVVVLPLAALHKKHNVGAFVWSSALWFIAVVGVFIFLAGRESILRMTLVAFGISCIVFVVALLTYRRSERPAPRELPPGTR